MRVAVVTGASQGIGRQTADVLDSLGWALALIDLQTIDIDGYKNAVVFTGDITDEKFVSTTATESLKKFGRIDALVNNAGISNIAPALKTSAETYRKVLEVNLVAPFLLAKAFGEIMLNVSSGSIVNVSSVAGLQGVADRSAYNASKHGLIGLTRTLAVEWGARGVRVNAVCPGWVKTEMDHKDQAGGSYTDLDITDHVPMARFARPEDIAQAIVWLCDSSKSGFVNGVALPVDGGWTADGSWQSLKLEQRG
ncbi:MAG: SDR family NAD(P)-dependent oxidoreductase [Actinobacteria bacterium]|nr:SDR family NAD(P)-dependent oxidoreductase [Actinomycetota bacterium]